MSYIKQRLEVVKRLEKAISHIKSAHKLIDEGDRFMNLLDIKYLISDLEDEIYTFIRETKDDIEEEREALKEEEE